MDLPVPTFRLSRVARELNVGIKTIIDFLLSKGYAIDRDPNTKLTLEQYNLCRDSVGSFISDRNIKNPIDEGGNITNHKQSPVFSTSSKYNERRDAQKRTGSKKDDGNFNEQPWMIGRIKFFNNTKGFGFVGGLDDLQDYFVHVSQVDTNPIDDSDIVVFKLKPSRKKPGTFEAIKVNLVAQFHQNVEFLFEQFIKFPDESIKNEILKSLSEKEKIRLFESVIKHFCLTESGEIHKDFKGNIKWVLSDNLPIEMKNEISEKLPLWIVQDEHPSIYIRLWIDGLILEPPKEKHIITRFLETYSQERLQIFKLLSTETKVNILTTLTRTEEPKKVIDFIFDHIKQLNGIHEYVDIKSKLNDKEYWLDKKGYDLLTTIIGNFNNTLDEKSKFDLFFNGYFNSFSRDFVFANSGNLTHDEIVKICLSGLLTEQELILIVKGQIYKELDELNKPNSFINNQQQDISKHGSEWDKYGELSARPFIWIFSYFKNFLDISGSTELGECITEMPKWLHFTLWEHGYTNIIPEDYISSNFLFDGKFELKIERWLTNHRIEKDKAIQLMMSNIQKFQKISSRKDFYLLHKNVTTLCKFDIKCKEVEILFNDNLWFFKLICWLEGFSSEFNFDEFRTKLVFLTPEHQIKFLRKLFFLSHTKQFDLTAEKLNQLVRIDFDIFKISEEVNTDVHLDISVDVVVEAIKSFSENGKFLFDSQLLSIVIKNITVDKKFRFKISELFEKCEGRYGFEYNWRANGEIKKEYFGDSKFYYAIDFKTGEQVYTYNRHGGYERFVPNEHFEEIKEKVKLLPGRKWNPDKQHWGVPSSYEEQVLQFARENRFFIHGEGSKTENNIHLAELKLKDIPNGIQFCEGRLAKIINKYFRKEFWWCCNQPCFNHSETIHNPEDWEHYTFLDFMLIMGFDLDDGNRVGDYIERGKYYQFISTINQFNRLLERMYCDSCNHILYPIEDAHFAHHRVVRFHCENSDCTEYHEEIYLHHCLNGRCNGIIDSRWSKKCPNGLYICSNETCGGCCSHDMLSRRLQNLRTTGGYVHQNLINAVENKLGHLERAEHFCYKCGKQMEEFDNDVFECMYCHTKYDVSKNKFKRPYRHLAKSKTSLFTEEPPPEPEDFFPF